MGRRQRRTLAVDHAGYARRASDGEIHLKPPLVSTAAEIELERLRSALQAKDAELAAALEQRAHAEAETQRLTALLDTRKQAFERLAKNIESFSYTVSHDLRAPLRAIAGYAGMLCETEISSISADGRHMLERIAAGAHKMDQLLKDILEYSRVERLQRRDSVVDMTALATQIAQEQLTSNPSAKFVCGDLPRIGADPAMVQKILSHLIGNAFKFSAKRTDAVIEIGVTTTGDVPEFFVRDNGAGFNQRYAGKLFNLFQRMHTEQEFAGTGVGLAVVKRLVEHHGGRVSAESEPGGHTVFRFTLMPAAGTTIAT
jgi:light-regulated signal transduction histidine kinase (bacteriophytochrome)